MACVLDIVPLLQRRARLKWVEPIRNLPTDVRPGMEWEKEDPAFSCLSEKEWDKVLLGNVKVNVSLTGLRKLRPVTTSELSIPKG